MTCQTNASRSLVLSPDFAALDVARYDSVIFVSCRCGRTPQRCTASELLWVSHSVELRAQGYKLSVLPGAFVVHTPHAPSPDITAFRADPHYRVCLSLLKQEFMDDLKRKYNVTLEDNQTK
ncbi:unnamed protein product [Danaus chrysippus]|uniref:(African queen) hypothetical protein n=1 Tax=Danaus chrysippus TaxID=151541 RepID=A0A8J2QYY5_9NEOP|nr:unnamed protein product [Danaus chrysippus]